MDEIEVFMFNDAEIEIFLASAVLLEVFAFSDSEVEKLLN